MKNCLNISHYSAFCLLNFSPKNKTIEAFVIESQGLRNKWFDEIEYKSVVVVVWL